MSYTRRAPQPLEGFTSSTGIIAGPWVRLILDGKTKIPLPAHSPGATGEMYRNIQNEYLAALQLRYDLKISMLDQMQQRMDEICTAMRFAPWQMNFKRGRLAELTMKNQGNSALRFLVKSGFEYNDWLQAHLSRLEQLAMEQAPRLAMEEAETADPDQAPGSRTLPSSTSASTASSGVKRSGVNSTASGSAKKTKHDRPLTGNPLLDDPDAFPKPVRRSRVRTPRCRQLVLECDDFVPPLAAFVPVDRSPRMTTTTASTNFSYPRYLPPLGGVHQARAGRLAPRILPRPPQESSGLLAARAPTPEFEEVVECTPTEDVECIDGTPLDITLFQCSSELDAREDSPTASQLNAIVDAADQLEHDLSQQRFMEALERQEDELRMPTEILIEATPSPHLMDDPPAPLPTYNDEGPWVIERVRRSRRLRKPGWIDDKDGRRQRRA